MTIKNNADLELSLIDLQFKLDEFEKELEKNRLSQNRLSEVYLHLDSEFKRLNKICAENFDYNHFEACREIFLKLLRMSKKLDLYRLNNIDVKENTSISI